MDRIETMKAFVTVAEEGSCTKAAEKLQLSNQLVSKYVSQFEEQLGVRLFNRTTRRVHLTEEGEQCLPSTVLCLPVRNRQTKRRAFVRRAPLE